jgi:hypothetical protein
LAAIFPYFLDERDVNYNFVNGQEHTHRHEGKYSKSPSDNIDTVTRKGTIKSNIRTVVTLLKTLNKKLLTKRKKQISSRQYCTVTKRAGS